jgi:hypothetical protein
LLFLTLLSLLLDYLIYSNFSKEIDTLKSLILRIHPFNFVSNEKIIFFLDSNLKEKNNE